MKLTLRNLIFICTIFLIGTLFCPVFFKQIPFPLSSSYFWMLSSFLLIFIYSPTIYLSKRVQIIYFFFILYLLGSVSFWNDRYLSFKGVIFSTGYLLLPVILNEFYIEKKNWILYRKVVLATITIISISSIYYIYNVIINPSIARGHVVVGSILEMYHYGFFYGIIFIFPAIIFLIKTDIKSKRKKNLYIVATSLIFLGIIQSQYVTAAMISMIMIVLALLSAKKVKKNIKIVVILFILILIIPAEIQGLLLQYIADFLPEGYIQDQFNDFGNTIALRDFDVKSDETYFSRVRLSLLIPVLDSIGTNIFLGSKASSGHFFWIDQFSLFGIIGLVPWFLFFREFFRFNMSNFSEDFKSYYLIVISAYFLTGLVKGGMVGWYSMMILFFVIPGFNFVPLNLFSAGFKNKTSEIL